MNLQLIITQVLSMSFFYLAYKKSHLPQNADQQAAAYHAYSQFWCKLRHPSLPSQPTHCSPLLTTMFQSLTHSKFFFSIFGVLKSKNKFSSRRNFLLWIKSDVWIKSSVLWPKIVSLLVRKYFFLQSKFGPESTIKPYLFSYLCWHTNRRANPQLPVENFDADNNRITLTKYTVWQNFHYCWENGDMF